MRTVAGTLEAALASLLDEPVKITGAGRTDSGVHASGQVVSFSTRRDFPFERLPLALNSALPGDLRIRDAAVVESEFSARFSARERTYVFVIFNSRHASPLLARYAYHVWRPLEVRAMIAAAPALLGEHDFRAFCGVLPEGGNTVRCVRSLAIESRGDLIRLEVRADGFLHHMVRTIVGTLVECGTGRRSADGIAAVLLGRQRSAAGHTAPPNGLYLAGVRYEGGYDSFAEPPMFRW